MAFDENLDVTIDSVVAVEHDKTRICMKLARYDGGDIKLQFDRQVQAASAPGGWKFARLGRLTPAEFVACVPVAMNLLDKYHLLEG